MQTSGAAQRSQRLKGHVSVCPSVSLHNTMVILVDDIVTTGATMRSCVETMRKEGATVVTVLAGSHSGRNAEGWPNASMVTHASAVT